MSRLRLSLAMAGFAAAFLAAALDSRVLGWIGIALLALALLHRLLRKGREEV